MFPELANNNEWARYLYYTGELLTTQNLPEIYLFILDNLISSIFIWIVLFLVALCIVAIFNWHIFKKVILIYCQ